MFQKIKKLADDAIALQNKNAMEAALREISALCVPGPWPPAMTADEFEAAELAQHQTRNDPPPDPAVTLKDGAGGTVEVQQVKLTPAIKKARKVRK